MLKDDLGVDGLHNPSCGYFCDAVGLHESDPDFGGNVVKGDEVFAENKCKGLVGVEGAGEGEVEEEGAGHDRVVLGEVDLGYEDCKVMGHRGEEDPGPLLDGVCICRILEV